MAQVRYRAADPGELDWRQLDGLNLIYHRPSGQTHIAASPVPEILSALGDGALTVTQLFDRLALEFDLGERSSGEAELTGHLDALDGLGLVRRA